MNDTELQPLMDELVAIKNYLRSVQDMLKTGAMPSMIGLEKRVAVLCEGIQKSDVSVQKQCLPEMATLLQDLDDCERSMRKWYESLKGGKA
jgi:hypothetical protein